MLKTVTTIAVTATPDTYQLPQSNSGWTLRNDDATYSIFYINSRDYPDGAESAFAGASKAILKALGASELRAGESIFIQNDVYSLTVVCITGGTASMDIEAGHLASSLSASINVGNVGLVNAAEVEISPAVSVVEDAAHASGEAINPVAAVQTTTRAALATTTGDWTPLQTNANGELRVRSDDNCKGLVVPQTDVTVSDAVAVWNAALAIPAAVLAVRVFTDAACYVVVNATATRIANASGGAPVPADKLIDIPCVGCTYLHLAKVAGNVAFKYSYVYAS